MKATRRELSAALALLLVALAACSAAPPPRAAPGIRIFATSAEPIPTPSIAPIASVAAVTQATPAPPPTPTVTPGPLAYVLDFKSERRDVTMHVGERLQLKLSSGVSGDWISGVDDARVLAPVDSAGNGIYQALVPGTALVTAHVLYGCANVTPGVPCKPERGLWFQMRVYVLP